MSIPCTPTKRRPPEGQPCTLSAMTRQADSHGRDEETVVLRQTNNSLPWLDGTSAFNPVDEEAARRLTRRLRADRVRRAASAVVAQALAEVGYEAMTYPYVARLAGIETEDLERVLPSKVELVLSALGGGDWSQAALTLPGHEIVLRCLAFWERDENVPILRELLRTACRDRRLAAALEGHILGALIRPFAEKHPTTDAYPRARLAFAQLLGLAVSRYLLWQEPLASADHETLAAWIGPSLDQFLHGQLGAAVEARPSARPAKARRHPLVEVEPVWAKSTRTRSA
jgi:hypothetical protein